MNENRLRWGLLATGHIAAEFADGVKGSRTGVLHAVGSRSQSSADKFGAAHGVERCYGSYEELLADSEVDAIYVSTPHPMHAAWAIRAAEAGKHLLVEKPIGMNAYEAAAIIDAAELNDVFLMEAFMYRCHPQMAALKLAIESGAIGDVAMIQATFGYHGGERTATNRAFAQELGGGGILDVGCYPVSASRLIAGMAHGKPFLDPISVKGHGRLGTTGVDEWAAATLLFEGGIVAQVCTSVGCQAENVIRVFGTKGVLLVADPWIPSRWNRDTLYIEIDNHDGKDITRLAIEATEDLYTYEADMVGGHIGQRQAPAMSWDDTLGNMRTLDQWRAEIGLVYDLEKPSHSSATIRGLALRAPQPPAIPSAAIPGVEKRVSRLILGCDNNNDWPDTAIRLDTFFELGGNTFDTSHGYGFPLGSCERNLGAWIRSRGVRDEVVVIEKGANAPNNTGEGLTRELISGLERLGLDYVDFYMIHRDNVELPIEEWVEALNENLQAGRMKAFGLSNFTIPRLEAFKAYAQKRGLASYSAVSNHLSLSDMLYPLWDDCYLVSSGDQESLGWFERTQTVMLPWSSQGRGFFLPGVSRDNLSNPWMVKCWHSEANFQRRDRAVELAEKYGVEPIAIALAWVLNQPFPTLPLVGPRRPREFHSTLRAFEAPLAPEEVKWLRDG